MALFDYILQLLPFCYQLFIVYAFVMGRNSYGFV